MVMKLQMVTNYINNNNLRSLIMSTKKGPFGLRLPADLLSWLRYGAPRHNRSTTSEVLFLLQNSLTHRFAKTTVREFLKQYSTLTNTEVFGLRILDDLKTRLCDFSLQQDISLNMEYRNTSGTPSCKIPSIIHGQSDGQ